MGKPLFEQIIPAAIFALIASCTSLSEAERQQNYFVDLARAFGVGVAGVAELSAEEKDKVSHRGKALRMLKQELENEFS